MRTTMKPQIGEDEDFVFGMPKEPLGYTVKTHQLNNFNVHINEEIKDASYYSKVFELLLDAGENDSVNFFIASNGGDLDGLNILLEGIRLTEAHVCAILVGPAHSAASILALNCHNIIVTESASMLTHNIRTGFGGKIADLEAFTNFSRKISNKLIKETYTAFLEPEELEAVIHGKELWLDAAQIRERLQRRMEFLESKYEAEQQAVSKVQEQPKKPSRKKAPPKE